VKRLNKESHLIQRLIEAGVLKRRQSPWNTPLLPVKKPRGTDFRPVQDLREVNKRLSDIHPSVPNPYTLLSNLPPNYIWYTVLDLKDAFFSLPLAPTSQEIFAFEWQEDGGQTPVQLTWTHLPQGFKNSPTLFNEALDEDLHEYRVEHPTIVLLQYVDDLMLAAATEKDCQEATGMGTLPPTPEYSSSDLTSIQENTNLQKGEDGWYRDSDDYLILPTQLGRQLCEHLHLTTHLGEKKTLMLFQTAHLRFPRHQTTMRNIVHACKACQQMRPGKGQHAGLRYQGEGPGQHWEIDFTEVH
uniref:Uncharacterized protein n=1 Tax=Ovis aries TaxID=9940 RepID=A0AC11EIT5_SHEEP